MCLGIPGKIVEAYQVDGIHMGKINFGGAAREVCLEYIPEAKLGDYCLVHAGFAITLLNEEDALETLKLIAEMEAESGIKGMFE